MVSLENIIDTETLTPIESLIPHRDTLLLLDALIYSSGEIARAVYTPREDAWYSEGGAGMPAWFGIELMAQTIAAQVALQKKARGLPPKMGVLLGTRRYVSSVPYFVAGRQLTIQAHSSLRDQDSGLGAYDCVIECLGEEIASAALKVYEPHDFSRFVEGN